MKTRCDLKDHYLASPALWSDLTVNDLLMLPVAPPVLASDHSMSRSEPDTKQERLYPDTLYAWVDFEKEVQSFTEPAVKKGTSIDNVLYRSLQTGTELRNQDDEQAFVIEEVIKPLQKAGLLEHGTKSEADLLKHHRPLGKGGPFPHCRDEQDRSYCV